MKTFLLVILSSLPILLSLTTSKATSYTLFQIGRSKDKDIIKYDINLTSSGTINTEKPLKIYWVRDRESNKVEALSYIQNKMAYGVKYKSISSTEVKFQFVSYDKRTFVIKKINGSDYKVITYLDKKGVEIKRLHVQIDGGTFMVPKVSYVNVHWMDPYKGNEGIEKIIP